MRSSFLTLCLTVAAAGVVAAGRVSAPTLTQRSPDFLTLFNEYRRGDADAAVKAFAGWAAKRVEAEAILPAELQDESTLAALALLHLEAGISNDSFGTRRPEVRMITGTVDELETHFRTAFQIIDRVFRRAEKDNDSSLLNFCRLWYVTASPYEMSNPDRWLSLVEHRFPGDPEVLLLRGLRAERSMGPEVRASRGLHLPRHRSVGTSHGRFDAVDAEKSLRRALVHDPTLVEARLRLGRLLYLLDRAKESQAELERTLRDAREKRDIAVGYRVALLLGRLHEDANRLDVAAQFYKDAIAANPRGQAAYVALGQLLITSGRVVEGWATIRGVFAAGGVSQEPPLDPWYPFWNSYETGHRPWEQPGRIRAMRDLVRR